MGAQRTDASPGRAQTEPRAKTGGRRKRREPSVGTMIEEEDDLDDRAKDALYELPASEAMDLLELLRSKGNEIRNPSAFVVRAVSNKKPGGAAGGRRQSPSASPRGRGRGPRARSADGGD